MTAKNISSDNEVQSLMTFLNKHYSIPNNSLIN